ncbi:hypothetical protein EYR40_000615 [Pleurotus pulmonarius]|nr:hypothetical protein EYR40_000615 [Pleurotus pulmonarius]
MDPNNLPDTQQILTTPSRKRGNRENETPQQRIKREKAAERQRRKRERDRNAAGLGLISYQTDTDTAQVQQPQAHHISVMQQTVSEPSPPQQMLNPDLTPEEAARRERVRAAARERQRKHRLLVKQRKMRELGLEMAPDMVPMEEMRYPDGHYQQVLQHELQQPQIDPPFPPGPPIGGQTFASTLLLSFSSTPLLKQHLLRTLNMTNEELASLEPIIAESWDRWDHQRRMHGHPGASGFQVEMGPEGHPLPPNSAPYPAPVTASADPNHPSNEFRARFHRPLVAPTPFRTFTDSQGAAASTPGSTNGSLQASPDSAVDPQLSNPTQNGTSEGGS